MQLENAQPGVVGDRAAPLRPRHSEARSAALITSLKMVGKSLGLLKSMVIAAWFGAGGALDAFWIAYTIPAMMPGLVLGVVTTAFIPSFMRSARNGHERIDWRGLNTLFTLITILVVVISVSVYMFSGFLVSALAPGVPEDVHALAAELTSIMAIAVLLFGINAMLSAIMQATHRFALMSLESIVTNIVIIAGAVLLGRTFGVHAVVYAVIAGFGTHMLLLLWGNRDLVREKLRPAFDFSHQDFTASAMHMLPLLLGFLGSVSMSIIDKIFVSTLDSGAITIIVYASMIALLPMEVFGHAVFTAFYPGLSRDYANGDMKAMQDAQVRGQRLLLFVILPVTAGFVMAAGPIITLLLERGAFTSEASSLTAMAMAALAIGLPFRAWNYFNFRMLHARKEPWTAVGIGLFGVCTNVLLDMLLIGPFGVVGIAFATSIAMAACSVLSSVILRRRQRGEWPRVMMVPVGQLLLMTGALILTAQLLFMFIHSMSIASRHHIALLELAAFLPAGLVFLWVGHLLRFQEVYGLVSFFRKPFGQGAG